MTINERSKMILAAVLGVSLGVGATLALDPAAQTTKTERREPNLCDLDGGRWCEACGGPGEVTCPPAEASGWLCCNAATGVCVASGLTECGENTLGWCANYTESPSGDATCHD